MSGRPGLHRGAERCRACDSRNLYEVLDLGQMPLAGDFRPPGEANPLYPLAIDGCMGCGLLQVRQTVDQALLFGPAYAYASSTVPALVEHFASYARAVGPAPEGRARKLLEIGCNDGVFLRPLAEAGFRVVGIDASDNVAQMARDQGLAVITDLFSGAAAQRILAEHGAFDVVTCSNVFAHNPDVNGFLTAMASVLKPGGEFWVEVHSAHALREGLQWDCFYHEHCFYWTIHALGAALGRQGFGLRSWETTPMHGGSLRAVFQRGAAALEVTEPRLRSGDWEAFGAASRRSRHLIRDSVERLGLHFAYGAAGRAVVLVNWTGIGEHLQFVVDGSPLRAGRALPGAGTPILSEAEFFAGPGDFDWCFVTAHNYIGGIRRKVETRWPERFIKFVTPLPQVRIQ